MSISQKAVVKENQNFGTKALPFEAPYGYFENLPTKVWAKAQQQPKVVFWLLLAFRYGLAGLLTLSLAWWIWKPVNSLEATQAALNEVTAVEIADYLLVNSDPQGMVLMAQAEPLNWEEILPAHVSLNVEDAWPWIDESEIIAAWEEI